MFQALNFAHKPGTWGNSLLHSSGQGGVSSQSQSWRFPSVANIDILYCIPFYTLYLLSLTLPEVKLDIFNENSNAKR